MTDLNQVLAVAKEAAIAAGNIIKDGRKDAILNTKAHLEPVTSVDVAVDKLIVSIIKKHFPNHGILSEELAPDPSKVSNFDSPLWVVDPIDGTANFMYRQPAVGVSIAFLEKCEVKAAIVHAPFYSETFTAIKGGGAYCNGEKISVGQTDTLRSALIATGFPYERDQVELLTRRVKAVLSNCRDIRRVGAASIDLCWLACGRHDAYYETVKPWDIAAGLLIAREAGALTGFIKEKNSRLPDDIDGFERLTAGPKIYDKLLELLRQA